MVFLDQLTNNVVDVTDPLVIAEMLKQPERYVPYTPPVKPDTQTVVLTTAVKIEDQTVE